MKKIFAALLVGLMAVSISACSNNNSSSNSSAPAASSSTQQSSTVSETQQSSQASSESSASSKDISKFVDVNKLGKKTLDNFVNKLSGDKMTLTISGESEMSAASSESSATVSKVKMSIAKSNDNVYMNVSLSGSLSYDITTLTNEKGTYLMSSQTKTALFTPKSDTSEETSDTANTIGSMFGSTDFKNIEYKGDGTEEYQGKTYSFEEYTNNGSSLKMYFDGDKPEYIVSKDSTGKEETVKIDELSSDADESLFTVPSDYKITEQSALSADDSSEEASKTSSKSEN